MGASECGCVAWSLFVEVRAARPHSYARPVPQFSSLASNRPGGVVSASLDASAACERQASPCLDTGSASFPCPLPYSPYHLYPRARS